VAELLPGLLAIAIGLALGGIFALALGVAPGRFYGELVQGTLGSGFGIGQVLYRATPLLFTGLSVALAFRAGLFNIGAEGQMAVGALAMAWAGAAADWPLGLGLAMALGAGALAGGIWGGIPGILKARTGSHEVIVTLLLNFVAFAVVNYALVQGLALPETVRTAEVATGARLERLETWLPALRGSPASLAIVAGAACALLLHLWLRHSTAGFSLQILGEGLRPARYAGLRVGRGVALAMSGAGALAGMAGAGFVLGFKHYFEEGLTAGAGFLGIGVALLARNRPLWIVPAALFFGALSYGGFVVNRIVPREMIDVLQAIILLLFILFDRALGARRSA
jgi:simple sugar transport system permease protein